MSSAPKDPPSRAAESVGPVSFALSLILVLTVWRVGVLFVSPIGLYPEEAQYWLWSRDLAFGYFSKPPMIAWLIGATTAIGGEGEALVRLSAPLMHGLAALGVLAAGRRLYGAREGALGAALYILMPGVALSSFVIATDAPLLAFLSLTLAAYAAGQTTGPRGRVPWAAAFGAMLGLAFLAKYAALYAIAGAALHAAWSPAARKAWSPAALAAAAVAFALVVAPNVVWNLTHGLQTVAHTASNAGLETSRHFQLTRLAEFFGAQFGVFGPVPFAVFIGGAVLLARRNALAEPDRLLLSFAAPPLAIILVLAFVTHANANWAAAAYVPGAVLAAAWLVRWLPRARPWIVGALVLQAAVAVVFLAGVTRPSLGDALGLGNSFKRARGWEELTRVVIERARVESGGGALTAVVTQDRFTFNSAAYYGRDAFGHDLPPLRMWVRGADPRNQAEAVAALTPAQGARVLVVSLDPADTPRIEADFSRILGRQIVSVRLDSRRSRRAEIFLAEGFHPASRLAPAPPRR